MTPSNSPSTLNPSSASQIRGLFLFLTLDIFLFLITYMHVQVHRYTICRCSWSPEEDVGSLDAIATGGCEIPNVGAELIKSKCF